MVRPGYLSRGLPRTPHEPPQGRRAERGNTPSKVTEDPLPLGDYVPASDYRRSTLGASFKQLGFIANLADLLSSDPLLFHFMDTVREAGVLDIS